MFISSVINFFKKCWLYITRLFRHVFKHIGIKLSILFVIFSFLISMFLMIPSLFSRVPVFSYLINTLSLPISYKLEGIVLFVDSNDEEVDQSVTIYVGGYKVDTISGEPFVLNFASEKSDYLYVTIEYDDETGNETIISKKVETKDKTTLKEVIKIHV